MKPDYHLFEYVPPLVVGDTAAPELGGVSFYLYVNINLQMVSYPNRYTTILFVHRPLNMIVEIGGFVHVAYSTVTSIDTTVIETPNVVSK
jgi:hypothetical protein